MVSFIAIILQLLVMIALAVRAGDNLTGPRSCNATRPSTVLAPVFIYFIAVQVCESVYAFDECVEVLVSVCLGVLT